MDILVAYKNKAEKFDKEFDRRMSMIEDRLCGLQTSNSHPVKEAIDSLTPSPEPELCVSVETDMISKGTSDAIEVDEDSSAPEWESKADGCYLTPIKVDRSNDDDQGYLLLQKKKLRFGKPPAKPPDDVVLRVVTCCEPNNVWHRLSSHLMSCGCHIRYCSKYWDLGLPLIQSLWLSDSRNKRCFSWFNKWMLDGGARSLHILFGKDSKKCVLVWEQVAKVFKEKLIFACVEDGSSLIANDVLLTVSLGVLEVNVTLFELLSLDGRQLQVFI